MLRVQPTSKLGALEKETLANMERDGLRATQFVKSSIEDRERAAKEGWEGKLLDFAIPGATNGETFEAVLDSLAGFTSCGSACAVYQKLAEDAGVVFKLGDQHGAFDGFVEQAASGGKKKVTGLRTKDGQQHVADTVVVAGEPSIPLPCVKVTDVPPFSWLILDTDLSGLILPHRVFCR